MTGFPALEFFSGNGESRGPIPGDRAGAQVRAWSWERKRLTRKKSAYSAVSHAAFVIMLGNLDAAGHGERAGPGEDHGARVTFLLGAVPISGVSGRPELLDDIGRGLGLLKAQDVRRFLGQVIQEILCATPSGMPFTFHEMIFTTRD